MVAVGRCSEFTVVLASVLASVPVAFAVVLSVLSPVPVAFAAVLASVFAVVSVAFVL